MSAHEFFDSIHVAQQQSWDCGVACCRMALKFAGITDINTARLEELSRPVWTIDILEALVEHGVACEMTTTCAGINPSHRDRGFYDSHRDSDESRVSAKFAAARSKGWPVIEVKFSMCYILLYNSNI